MNSIEKLGRAVALLQKQVLGLSATPQLSESSIEDGAIDEYNADGDLVGRYGEQFDGTHAAATLSGPPPPQPTAPICTGGPATLTVRWDGIFVDANGVPDLLIFAPMDFTRVEVHVSLDPEFTAEYAETLIGTIESPRGGEVPRSLEAGTYYVRLVARSASGKASTPSAVTSVEVEELVSGEIILDEIDAAVTRIENADKIILETGVILGDKLGGLDTSLTQVNTDLHGEGGLDDRLADAELLLDDAGQLALASGETLAEKLEAQDQVFTDIGADGGPTGVAETIEGLVTLGVDQLAVTGTANIDTAVVDKLFAETFATRKLYAENVVIGSDPSAFAPSLLETPEQWEFYGDISIIPSSITAEGRRFNWDGVGTVANWAVGPWRKVSPGEKLYAEATSFKDNFDGGAFLRYYWYDENQAYISYAESAESPFAESGTKYSIEEAIAPAGTAYARLRVGLNPSSTAGSAGFFDVIGKSLTPGNLIVNGAITAPKITASEELSAKVGEFLALKTDQLTVTGSAGLNEAVIEELYADVVRSRKMTTDMLLVGNGLNLIPNGSGELGDNSGWPNVLAYDTVDKPTGLAGSFRSAPASGTVDAGGNGWPVEPDTEYLFEVWLKADKPNSRLYIEMRDQGGNHGTVTSSIEGKPYAGGGSYPVTSHVVPTTWTKYYGKTVTNPDASELHVGRIYFNHPNGTEQTATVWIAGLSLKPRVGDSIIATGAITAPKISASEEMWAKVLGAHKITTTELKSNAIDGMVITGARMQTTASANRGIKINNGGNNAIEMWNSSGSRRFYADGDTGEVSITGGFETLPAASNVTLRVGSTYGPAGTYSSTNPGVAWTRAGDSVTAAARITSDGRGVNVVSTGSKKGEIVLGDTYNALQSISGSFSISENTAGYAEMTYGNASVTVDGDVTLQPYAGRVLLNGPTNVSGQLNVDSYISSQAAPPRAVSDPPTDYPDGVSFFDQSSGWPLTYATIFTVKINMYRGFQVMSQKTDGEVWTRSVGDNDWGPWHKQVSEVGGVATMDRLRLTNEGDASGSSSGHAFQIGNDSGPNIVIDGNEILYRNNGNIGQLFIEGGISSGGDIGLAGGKSIAMNGSTRIRDTGGSTAGTVFQGNSNGNGYAAVLQDVHQSSNAGIYTNSSGPHCRFDSIYTTTTSAGANVHTDSNGYMYRSTSASKYKLAVNDLGDIDDKLLSLKARTWFDAQQSAEVADYYDRVASGEPVVDETGDQLTMAPPVLKPIPGMIAEEVEAAGLADFVVYGDDGQVEGLMYDRLAVALIPTVARLRDRLATAEARIAAQDERLAKLEAALVSA